MSRIGKQEIILSKQITADITKNVVTIKGPKGELQQTIADIIRVEQINNDNQEILLLHIEQNTKKARELHGLSRTLINNMVIGVRDGFTKDLEIRGVGYRSQMDGRNLILNVGYSHPVLIQAPEGINIKVESNTNIIISGINKELVGQTAAKIRAVRRPEPYKGKGIRYKNEVVKKKIGKAGK
uniref:Large ribosomal subunit protein uL6c n=1 Tax=Helminthora furcellata TaxID=1884666 RepID=A0A1G4NZK3_9FLOR|nr:Ribosomal protein L6 [Helminthora furcellata]SCW21194.1 Ribosomal protein L6 [Helminthora furcellata]SCW24054.1 Ribosomal protein L6 [Helminthora furcellata]